MFHEHAELIEAGNLEDAATGDGAMGFRLAMTDNQIITVRGLSKDHCKNIAKLYSQSVTLSLDKKVEAA